MTMMLTQMWLKARMSVTLASFLFYTIDVYGGGKNLPKKAVKQPCLKCFLNQLCKGFMIEKIHRSQLLDLKDTHYVV